MWRFCVFIFPIFALAQAPQPDGAGVRRGTLPVSWKASGPTCEGIPDWQVHEYNPDFYILRESGCTNYEKPFLYLLFGKDRVLLEGVQPVEVLAIPRSAVLSDQQGDYVFVVGADNKAEQRRIKLGQSTPTIASVTDGLKLGEKVVVEGLQKVKPGMEVAPGPASALLQASMKQAPEDPATQGSSDGIGAKAAGSNP